MKLYVWEEVEALNGGYLDGICGAVAESRQEAIEKVLARFDVDTVEELRHSIDNSMREYVGRENSATRAALEKELGQARCVAREEPRGFYAWGSS